jgi:hypothetical protein
MRSTATGKPSGPTGPVSFVSDVYLARSSKEALRLCDKAGVLVVRRCARFRASGLLGSPRVPGRVAGMLAGAGGQVLDGGLESGGSVLGERLAVTEARDRGVKAGQPAKRGGRLRTLLMSKDIVLPARSAKVELRGLEPLTLCLQSRCSSS